MTDTQEDFEARLRILWADRINLPVQSMAHEKFGVEIQVLAYEMDELRNRNAQNEEVLGRQRSENEEALKQLRSENEEVLKQLRSEKEEVLKQVVSVNEEVLKQLRSEKEEVLKQVMSVNEEELKRLRSQIVELEPYVSKPWRAPFDFLIYIATKALLVVTRHFPGGLSALFLQVSSDHDPHRFKLSIRQNDIDAIDRPDGDK